MRRNVARCVGTIALASVAWMGTGCASMLAYQYNQQQRLERAVIRGVQPAGGGSGVAVDLTAVVGTSPKEIGIQALGAIVDGAAIYGLMQLYERSNEDNDTSYTAGRDIRVKSEGTSQNDRESNNTEQAPAQ